MKKDVTGGKESRQLFAAWKKAAKDGVLEIPCPTLSNARQLRFTLYNAVKPVKDGKIDAPELLEAVRAVSIHLQDSPPMVVMQHRAFSPVMQSLAAALGDIEEFAEPEGAEPVMTAEEEASLRRMQELVGEIAPAPGTRVNPYYTKRGSDA